MDSIAGISCYLNKSNYRVVYNNFVFQQHSAPVHLAFNTVQLLLQSSQLPFSWAITVQSVTLLWDLESHIAAWAWVAS